MMPSTRWQLIVTYVCADAAVTVISPDAGIVGNLFGYPLLPPVAALIVGGMIVKMGATFGWDALHDLMARVADDEDVQAIRATLVATRGVLDIHDLRTRKTGDLILVDVHLDIDADLAVAQGHDIAVDARARVMKHHRVLNATTHVDPRSRESLPRGRLRDARSVAGSGWTMHPIERLRAPRVNRNRADDGRV